MQNELLILSELDQTLLAQFEQDEINAEVILQLVDKREQILQNILSEQKSDPGLKDSPEWLAAVQRTREIVLLMQGKTRQIGEELRKYRHGSKSVQRYQQFL